LCSGLIPLKNSRKAERRRKKSERKTVNILPNALIEMEF